jgi:hypothetical protein
MWVPGAGISGRAQPRCRRALSPAAFEQPAAAPPRADRQALLSLAARSTRAAAPADSKTAKEPAGACAAEAGGSCNGDKPDFKGEWYGEVSRAAAPTPTPARGVRLLPPPLPAALPASAASFRPQCLFARAAVQPAPPRCCLVRPDAAAREPAPPRRSSSPASPKSSTRAPTAPTRCHSGGAPPGSVFAVAMWSSPLKKPWQGAR